jgi:hypothetical protein
MEGITSQNNFLTIDVWEEEHMNNKQNTGRKQIIYWPEEEGGQLFQK